MGTKSGKINFNEVNSQCSTNFQVLVLSTEPNSNNVNRPVETGVGSSKSMLPIGVNLDTMDRGKVLRIRAPNNPVAFLGKFVGDKGGDTVRDVDLRIGRIRMSKRQHLSTLQLPSTHQRRVCDKARSRNGPVNRHLEIKHIQKNLQNRQIDRSPARCPNNVAQLS